MAKWLCPCGAVIRSSGDIPNPAEWLSVSDVDFAEFSGVIDAENLYGAMTHSFRCSKCGRFHVFWSGLDHDPAIYAVEATRQPEARDQGAQARVDSASRLAWSAEWSDRATAGYLLSSEAGEDRVDAMLRRLLLDEQDTGVTFATARALLERRDAIGLQLVLEANLDAAEDTGQWLFDAVSKVRTGSESDRTALRSELAAAQQSNERLSGVVAELLALIRPD